MELKRSMRDRIVDVIFDGVGGNDVVDLIMRHGASAKVVEASHKREDDDERDQQLLDCEIGPPGKNSFIEPAVIVGFYGEFQAFNRHKFVSDSDSQMIVNYTLPTRNRQVTEGYVCQISSLFGNAYLPCRVKKGLIQLFYRSE